MHDFLRRSLRPVAMSFVALVLGSSALATIVVTLPAPAAVATTNVPPWEPVANPPQVGGLTFYNAAGQPITGGSISTAPLAAYVQGTNLTRSGDTKATLFAVTPIDGEAPGQWSGTDQLSSSTVFPNSSAPSTLASATLPLVTGSVDDESLATDIADNPNNDTSADGYDGVYVLRLFTSSPGNGASTSYDAADILVSGTTWSVDYTALQTTTTLSVSPSGPVQFGTSVTLTATVTAGAAGSVQFYSGATKVGTPQTVSGGTASLVTAALPVGAPDNLSAVFSPTGTGYAGSTGTTTFTVSPISTTTTLTTTQSSPQPAGTSITLHAAVTSGVAGTVQFEVGTTPIGGPVTVSGGAASTSTSALPAGVDSLTATFSPTNTGAYQTSSDTISFTVTASPTTTTLTTTQPSPQPVSSSVTLNAAVTSGVAGTVQFEVGTTPIGGPVAVSGGAASTSTSALPAGVDSLTATFSPTNTGTYETSSDTISFTVTGPTTTTLTTTQSSPQPFDTSVTLNASVTSGVAGTVQFEVGTTPIGGPVAVSGGAASTSTSALPVGTDALTATFSPTNTGVYAASSDTISFTVTLIPTTTALTTTQASPQPFDTSVTLNAAVTSGVAGTVQFEVGTTPIGGPVTVSGGAASTSTSALPVGTDALTATFSPTNTGVYAASSDTISFTVTLIPTNTDLTVSPTGPRFVGTPETLIATVSPASTGTVQFKVGATNVGSPVTVASGTAAVTTSSLPVGTDGLTAVFTPTAGSGHAGSTGTASITVKPLTVTSTVLTTSPASPQVVGTAVTLTATVTSGATGSVQFEVGSTALGGPVPVSGGKATVATTSLPVGTDTLTAEFEPTAGLGYSGSTGSARFTINGRSGKGYWLVGADGGIFAFGNAGFFGSTGGLTLNRPIVGIAATPDGQGYWEVASDGGIFNGGDAKFFGSTGALTLNKPIVGIAATPDGQGYWEVASDGGIFAFGDAVFYGSTGALTLNKPIVGIAATPDGKGYWLVAADGGIFAFGDAVFYGSTGSLDLNKPIVGIASTPDGAGYWLVAADGGIFAFGDAVFYGSTGSLDLNKPIVGIAASPDGQGYLLVASDGGIFAFGDAVFNGSTGALALAKPIVGLAGS